MDRSRTGLLDRKPDPDPGATSRASFGIDVLGALEVRVGDTVVEIRRGLPRVVLSSLVIDRGRSVPADVLIDRLWGDALPHHPANALQTQIAYLRRMLGGSGRAPIKTDPHGYRLEGATVDVDAFEKALDRGRRLAQGERTESALVASLAAYDEALTLWRGSPYHDVAGAEFADAEIVRLEELKAAADEERCELLLHLGRESEAVSRLGSMVNEAPLREARQRLLVLALYRSGRQSEALRAYERARRTLADELGVEPGRSLREIERQVLEHDPALDWSPPVAGRQHASDRRPTHRDAAPSPHGALIGRDREMVRLCDLLAERRLVTLTGPGGAGKTRLALEVAARRDEPTTVVDLGGIDEPHRVPTLVAISAGASVTASDDPMDSAVEAFADAVGDEAVLLVLDTCEHVLDGVASTVEQLLAACPSLRVLATSRRPLELVDELAWPIPPLTVPTPGADPRDSSSFELFVERARAVAPDFDSAGSVAAIAELCRSLDGLPLAIELAAAQMDVLSPAAVQAQLAESRSLVNRAGGPERHRTLHATTAWSVGLLGDDERDMLYRLAVFVPTFDLDAALAVAGRDAVDAVDRFVVLVRNSLVVHGHGDRYRLLDTVKAFLDATDHDEERRAEAERRHATHYAALAARSFRKVRGREQAQWLRRLHDDRPNLRLALRWCFGPDGDEHLGAQLAGDIAWVWTLQGNMLDSRTALDRALHVDAEPLVRARLLLGIGLLAAPLGDHARVIEVCTESATLGRTADDDETVAVALLTLGVAHWACGDMESAAAAHDTAIDLFGTVGDVWSRTICRVLRARTARDIGDLALAEQLLEVAIDDAKQTGDDHVIGLAFEQYARLWLAHGEFERAAAAAETSLGHNESLDYTEGVAAALEAAAQIELARDQLETARDLAGRALGLAADIGHVGAMCAAIEALAGVEAREGRAATAARYLLIARRARRRVGLPLPPAREEQLVAELERLRREVGEEWVVLEAEVPMTSVGELARSITPSNPSSARPTESP